MRRLLVLLNLLILFTASAAAFPPPVPHPWRVTVGGGWSSYRMTDLNTKYFDYVRSDLPGNPRNLTDGPNFFLQGSVDYTSRMTFVAGIARGFADQRYRIPGATETPSGSIPHVNFRARFWFPFLGLQYCVLRAPLTVYLGGGLAHTLGTYTEEWSDGYSFSRSPTMLYHRATNGAYYLSGEMLCRLPHGLGLSLIAGYRFAKTLPVTASSWEKNYNLACLTLASPSTSPVPTSPLASLSARSSGNPNSS